MKILLRLSAVSLALGMLGAAACSSCSQANTNDTNSNSVMQQQSMTCGQGTHLVGTQCVNNGTTSTTSAASRTPVTLNSNGN